MTRTVPYDRIAPQDFYRQLDWIRDEWDDRDEYLMTKKLQRLERTFRRLPTTYYDRARPLIIDLGWCRVISDRPWRAILLELRAIVSDWGRTRRALNG